MLITDLTAQALAIPFKGAFAHAAATRERTETLWVTARAADGCTGYGEGCPREYVTGETLPGALAFVARHTARWRSAIADLPTLRIWVREARDLVDANPAAWTAVELALLDLLARRAGQPVEALLGVRPLAGRFRYTAVLGDAPVEAFVQALRRYRAAGFETFKVKLSGDLARDRAKVGALREAGIAPTAVRADANNLWADADRALAFLSALDYPFAALEEPLRAHDSGGMAQLSAVLGTAIVLDESLLRPQHLTALPAGRWIANVRVSKMGGVLRALELLDSLRTAGLPVIVGAHVGETSLLTRAALTVAHAAGDLLLAQEGAFGTHLLTRDVAEPPLMFGAGGVLDTGTLGASPGWGLALSPAPA